MSLWLRILNWSLKVSLHSFVGFHFKLCPMGAVLTLGCFGVGLIWDTSGLSKASQQSPEVR
jgi:hypothetical protein